VINKDYEISDHNQFPENISHVNRLSGHLKLLLQLYIWWGILWDYVIMNGEYRRILEAAVTICSNNFGIHSSGGAERTMYNLNMS